MPHAPCPLPHAQSSNGYIPCKNFSYNCPRVATKAFVLQFWSVFEFVRLLGDFTPT